MPSSLNSLFLARWHAVCYDEQRIWKLSMQNEQPIQKKKKKKTARATASMAVMKDQFHSFFFTILFFFFFLLLESASRLTLTAEEPAPRGSRRASLRLKMARSPSLLINTTPNSTDPGNSMKRGKKKCEPLIIYIATYVVSLFVCLFFSIQFGPSCAQPALQPAASTRAAAPPPWQRPPPPFYGGKRAAARRPSSPFPRSA